MDKKISILAPKSRGKEITYNQGVLNLGIETELDVNGIGMGVLSDGTPYLNQRGLAALCGVQNAHIGTISSQWNEVDAKPRIQAIKKILEEDGLVFSDAHIEINYKGISHYCYRAEICLAIISYYAFDAGINCQPEARKNFRILAGSKLRDMIYSQVGYAPKGAYVEPLRKWHERIELNHQSAPPDYFCVFNEANIVIYELIMAGAQIGEKMAPDISIGQCWAKYWAANNLGARFGNKQKFPHRYPDDHPQAKSNPQIANCYPLEALGEYRRWLQNEYLGGGKFSNYLKGQKALPPSVAQLAIKRLVPEQIEGKNI